MPIQSCQIKGRPGYRWGDSGTCYAYTHGSSASERAAREKAERQGRAIEAGRARRKGDRS